MFSRAGAHPTTSEPSFPCLRSLPLLKSPHFGGLLGLLSLLLLILARISIYFLSIIAPPQAVTQAFHRAAEGRVAPTIRPPPKPDPARFQYASSLWMIVRCPRRRLLLPWLIVGYIATSSHSHLIRYHPSRQIMDRKPSLSDLQAMAHSAELLGHEPSSRHTTDTGTESPLAPDRSTATLAEIIAAAVTSALASTKQMESPASRTVEATTPLADLHVRSSPRSHLEMDLGRIQVARTARGATIEARRKIRDRSCVAIEPKFAPMDFSKLTHFAGSEDLGTMVLAQQTMLDKFRTWCQQVDVAYIFQVPSVSDFQDHRAVATSSRISLLTHYKAISLATVLKYQAFVNKWLSDVDVESCDWALQVIELSAVPSLLVQMISYLLTNKAASLFSSYSSTSWTPRHLKTPSSSKTTSPPFALTVSLAKMLL